MKEPFLPAPALNVAVTGHRSRDWTPARWAAIQAAAEAFFAAVAEAAAAAACQPFFAAEPVALRVVTMLAEGADQLMAEAAARCSFRICAVLPGEEAPYRETIGEASRAAFGRMLADAETVMAFPDPVISDRSFERANRFILGQADLLLAVWDGEPARGRGGTAEVVQEAVRRGIPVAVLDPEGGLSTIASADELLLPPEALDLPSMPAAGRIEAIVAGAMLPPPGTRQRRALEAALVEPDHMVRWRLEYRLISLLGGSWRKRRHGGGEDLWASAAEGRQGSGRVRAMLRFQAAARRADALADHYGELTRSSEVLQFILLALAACVSGALAFFAPRFQPVALGVQFAVSLLILFDSTVGQRRRWNGRWTEYRVLAERLRCLRYLFGTGEGAAAAAEPERRGRAHWTAWLVRRLSRSVPPPGERLSEAGITASYRHLQSEIADQLAYHRRQHRRMTRLDRRLEAVSKACLTVSILSVGAQLLLLHPAMRVEGVRTADLAILSALAAAFLSSFRGLRSSVDTAGLAGQSAVVASRLAVLLRRMRDLPPTADRLQTAATAAARIMLSDLHLWQTALASRRPAKLRRLRLRRRPP